MALAQEKPRFTFGDTFQWEEERFELIHGELFLFEEAESRNGIITLQAAPSRAHQEASGELFAQFHQFLEGKPCKVYAAPFAVRLFEGNADYPGDSDTVVEPDLTIVCDPGKLDEHGCKGPPDMIIEVLSPTTQKHDRFTKLQLYEQAGVKEYWIVDPENQSVQTFSLRPALPQSANADRTALTPPVSFADSPQTPPVTGTACDSPLGEGAMTEAPAGHFVPTAFAEKEERLAVPLWDGFEVELGKLWGVKSEK